MKKIMTILSAVSVLSTSLVANAEDWSAPIQCVVESRVGNSGPKIEALSGMSEAERAVLIQTKNVGQNGHLVIENFNYKLRVVLVSSNTYSMRITDLSNDSTVSINELALTGSTVTKELELTKDYPVVNGMGVAFPRFTLKLKCDLRGQSANPIPDLTPGAPVQ